MTQLDDFTRLHAEEISYRLQKYDEYSDYHNKLVEIVKLLPRNQKTSTAETSKAKTRMTPETPVTENNDELDELLQGNDALPLDDDCDYDDLLLSLNVEEQVEFAAVISHQIWNGARNAETTNYDETDTRAYLESVCKSI